MKSPHGSVLYLCPSPGFLLLALGKLDDITDEDIVAAFDQLATPAAMIDRIALASSGFAVDEDFRSAACDSPFVRSATGGVLALVADAKGRLMVENDVR